MAKLVTVFSRLHPDAGVEPEEAPNSAPSEFGAFLLWSLRMRRSLSIAPASPDDYDTYLVLDDFGERIGRAWRETDEERTDRETIITDLLDGQYSDPARVIAFNTAEG